MVVACAAQHTEQMRHPPPSTLHPKISVSPKSTQHRAKAHAQTKAKNQPNNLGIEDHHGAAHEPDGQGGLEVREEAVLWGSVRTEQVVH